MHDSVIAESILKDLESYGKVKKAYIEVGELFGIEPDHLLSHLKEISSIEFSIAQTESKVECGNCGFIGRAKIIEKFHDFVLYECPECGSEVDVIKGDKIKIAKIEL